MKSFDDEGFIVIKVTITRARLYFRMGSFGGQTELEQRLVMSPFRVNSNFR